MWLAVAGLGLSVAAREQAGPASAKPAPVASHAAALTETLQTELVSQYLRHVPQRAWEGRAIVAGRLDPGARERVARHHREDDPQAARRHDAAARRPASRREDADDVCRVARIAHGSTGGGQPRSRLATVSTVESRRVRARGQAAARPRRRRHGVPARRHDQQRLRQRGRRADVLAHVDGGLPARGQPYRDARGRRSGQLCEPGHVQAAEDGVAARARRRRTARHARRHLGRAHLPSRWRLRLQHGLFRRAAGPALRQHRGRRADRSVARRRARGALRHQSRE